MLRIRHVLAPVDFSAACASAADCAYNLCRRFDADLTLLHVTPSGDGVTGLEMSPGVQQMLRARACRQMQELHPEFTEARVHRVLREGEPAGEIVKFAHNNSCDLIFMPTRGRGPLRRLLLGSVTAKVLHDADCPVWTGIHPEPFTPDGEFSIRRVGCAVDLGPQSRGALRWASEISAAFRAELVLFHILGPAPDGDWQQRLERLAKEQLAALLQDLSSSGECHVASGQVPRMVAELANGLGCSLLVIGRGHMSAGARLGGHAYAIIRDCTCPVASV